jgi:hypothetical protein
MVIAIFIECDNCRKIACLRGQAVFALEGWHDGFLYQFCPDCRHQPETQARILEDGSHVLRLAAERGLEVSNA